MYLCGVISVTNPLKRRSSRCCVKSVSKHEFRENRFTLLKGVNYVLPVISTFIDLFG